VIVERRWRVVLGAVGTTLALVALAVSSNPSVVEQFVEMAKGGVPQPLVSTPGTVLRLAVAARSGRDVSWLQLLPRSSASSGSRSTGGGARARGSGATRCRSSSSRRS